MWNSRKFYTFILSAVWPVKCAKYLIEFFLVKFLNTSKDLPHSEKWLKFQVCLKNRLTWIRPYVHRPNYFTLRGRNDDVIVIIGNGLRQWALVSRRHLLTRRKWNWLLLDFYCSENNSELGRVLPILNDVFLLFGLYTRAILTFPSNYVGYQQTEVCSVSSYYLKVGRIKWGAYREDLY